MAMGYTNSAGARAIIVATMLAGTLDILAAFGFAIMAGGSPLGVLRGIGGAVTDPAIIADPLGLAATGLAVHFAIMIAMASAYVLLASRVAILNRLPVPSGLGYGIMLWGIMYWVVLPRRWPTLFPVIDPVEVAMQLGSHVLLVGIPIALVAKAATRWR